MSYPPIPCAHCGTNFMRHDLTPDAPRICNSCIIRDKEREKTLRKPGARDMSQIQIIIDCDSKTQIEIEELCLNRGLTYSAYFLALHRTHKMFNEMDKHPKKGEPFDSGIKIEPVTEENSKGAMTLGKVTEDIEKKIKAKGAKK